MLKPGFENDIENILLRLLSSSSVTLRIIEVSSVELVLLGVEIVFKKDLNVVIHLRINILAQEATDNGYASET
jgi:hypothetical protein